ncbi:SDR family NAD(P)-dependent oxidoreductase [Azospirillum argentinense]
MRDPRSIVITGASSGIGEELARAYAAPGVALALSGRDSARLEAVAERCRAAGAAVETALVDAADRAAMAEWLSALDARMPVDLVIANAGISAGTGGGVESAEQARRIVQVNVDGVLNSVHPLLPGMQARRRGQIALMASLAGFRGMPGAPAYCASKAAVRVYGESLRGDLAGQGIGVTVICPGFVKSRMTAVNRFPMPFLMETDRAAQVIKSGLARNKARIAFPWPMAATVWLLAALPVGLTDVLLRQAPRKE